MICSDRQNSNLRIVRPRSLKLARIAGHTFIPGLLPADAVVVDLGANRGTFSSELNRRYGWNCYAVEPNPEVFAQIPSGQGISKINAAVTDHDGPVTFYLQSNTE